ncbi:hypothetical protein IFR05_007177 [Cadophora sp. M221]|nr:hypothetical protein IFR05_007177 [Cadophora sp. M221]
MPAESPRRRAATIKCQQCSQEFSRPEHLTRHLRTHTNERPYRCTICRKGFSRSDVLNRHHAAHHGPNAGDQRTGPSFRACVPCAVARVKCMGSHPCQRCSIKMIDCCYPETGRSRNQAQHTDAEESMSLEETNLSSNNNISTARPTVLDVSQAEAWAGIHSVATMAATQTQIGHADSEQPMFLSPNQQILAEQSLNAPSQVPGGYGLPEVATQPSTAFPSDGGYQLPSDDFNGTFASYPSVTPYDFALLANQSIEQPQLGDYGYSAINWLSPKDLGYSEFNYESQYFDINDFSFWTGPAIDSASEQNITGGGDITMSQSIFNRPDETQNNQLHFTPNSMQEAQTVPASTPRHDSPKTSSTPSKSPNYYIDGAGAREPRYGRLRKQHVDWEGTEDTPLPALDQDTSDGSEISFPSTIEQYLIGNENSTSHSFPQDIHQKLVDEFRKSCLGSSHAFPSDYFPSIGVFDMAKNLYFEYFHPVFPLLHKSSTVDNSESWLVELAIAAVGVNYLGTKISRQCSEAFIELLIRRLESFGASNSRSINDGRTNSRNEALFEIQAKILCCVAVFHSRNTNLVEKAFSLRSQLVGLCLRRKMLSLARNVSSDVEQEKEVTWGEFMMKESEIRAGYCIFWLDCLMAYQSDFRPQLRLEDAKASLPCREDLWEASDETTWQRAYSLRPERPSLLTALELLYKKKTIDSNIGEFGRILLIHGLYHRTWEVARYHKDALSNWIPSAPGTRAPSPSVSDATTEWLPRNPIFSKWRNSACDCLDVLHWSANSQVAQRAGLEHPTILHLHLARLILLTPTATVQSLASLIVQNSKSGAALQDASQAQYHEDRSEVLRWFIQDQYKARLALVHAGAIFWHVRRYSHDSMLEPFAVLLATLVVWAYATSSQAIEQQQRQGLVSSGSSRHIQEDTNSSRTQQHIRESETDLIDLPFINLDRLCDDELIQMYVLHGSRMKGYMAGIGDICKEGATVKILLEGAKIIACNGTHRGRFLQACGGERAVAVAALPTWGIGVRHALFLRELADTGQRRLG